MGHCCWCSWSSFNPRGVKRSTQTSCILTRVICMSPSWLKKTCCLFDTQQNGWIIWGPPLHPGAFWNIAGVLTGNLSSNVAFLHLSVVCRVNKGSWLENGPRVKILLRMETDDFQPENGTCTREYIWIRPYWNLSTSIASSCLSELNICKLCMWKMPSEQCSKPCSMKS